MPHEPGNDSAQSPERPQPILWYAAVGTSRPGAYKVRAVADSYRIDGVGTIVPAHTLAQVRKLLNSSAPIFYPESSHNPELQSAHYEFFAVQGGDASGIYPTLEDACDAVCAGGQHSCYAHASFSRQPLARK